MPATLTPPGIDRNRDRHDQDHTGDIGNGRRPPTDKRTGGNGDGEGWDGHPSKRRSPRERLSQARIGLFFALGGDLMFFIALVSVFFVDKNSGHWDAYSHWVNAWLPTTIPTILWLNTGVLLLSSITAEAARRGMFREVDVMDEWFGYGRPTSNRATLWLSVTLALGIAFIAGQWTAWQQLAAQHVFLDSNPSSKFFYIITWTHAIHLALGIIALITVLTVLQRSRQIATRQVFVDGTVWYWHMMGLLWVFLFLLLRYGQ